MANLFEDTPHYKLHRRTDPVTSKEAAHKVLSGKFRRMVLEDVMNAGLNGITYKEIFALHPGERHSSISSRPNELEKAGLVFRAGDKRDGCLVIRGIKYQHNFVEGKLKASNAAPEGDVRLTINMREDLHRRLKIEAAKQGTTIGELVEQLVEEKIPA